MTQKQIFFSVASSATLVKAFIAVVPVIWKGAPIRSCSIATSLLNSHYQKDNVSTNFTSEAEFQAFEKFVNENPFIEVRTIRTHHNQNSFSGIQLEQKPGEFFGTLSFFEEGQHPKDRDPVFLHSIVETLAKTLSFQSFPQIAAERIDHKSAEVIKAHQAQIMSLEKILEKQIFAVGEGLVKWDEKIREIADKLQEKFQERVTQLEASYSEKSKALLAAEEALANREKEVDDRAYQHARRGQFEEMKKNLVEGAEIKLSEETVRKRTPVFKSFVAIFSTSGLSALVFLIVAAFSGNLSYLIGFSISMVTLICFLVYFLRWQDYYYSTHADVEISNQLYKNDIMRANWLTEMVYESKPKEEAQFPQELLASFSRNLFSQSISRGNAPSHPYEEVLSVVKGVKNITIDNSGVKIENK